MRGAALLVLALALSAPARAQAPDEDALRREVGGQLLRLAARRTTPAAEHALLDIELERDGAPFDRARRVEVSARVREGSTALRLRFREPSALRDEAWLVIADAGEEVRAWRYAPAKRRAERTTPPVPTWRVGGSGLLWRDLWPSPGPADGVLARDDALRPDGSFAGTAAVGSEARAVHVVQLGPGAGPLLAIDRERHVPLLLLERDDAGGALRRLVQADWRWVGGALRPFALRVTEPRDGQVTRVAVAWRRPEPPPSHFDPDRFWE